MKRFFCTTCKLLKRSQAWPPDIANETSTKPEERLGTCVVCRALAQRVDRLDRRFRRIGR